MLITIQMHLNTYMFFVSYRAFNLFPKRQFSDSSKLKEFADILNFSENGRKFFNRVENTVGKGELFYENDRKFFNSG